MRRVIEFLLVAPRRLVVTVGIALVGPALIYTSVVGQHTAPTARPSGAPSGAATVRAIAPAPSAPSSSAPSSSPTAAPSTDAAPRRDRAARRVHAQAKAVTVAYLTAFLDHTGSDAAWQARLARLSTHELAQLNQTVPRAAVPTAQLRSVRVVTASPSYAALTARLSDGTVLGVAAVLDTDNTWRVTSVAPEGASTEAQG